MAFNIFANLDNVKKKRVVAKPKASTMSALPITNNVLAAITGTAIMLGDGKVQIGDTIIDGITGQTYSVSEQQRAAMLSTCASGDCAHAADVITANTTEYLNNVTSAVAPAGSMFEASLIKVDGLTLAAAAFAIYWFFLRKA